MPKKALQSNMVINMQITKVAEGGSITALLEALEVYLPNMNDINLATALHRVAKLAAKRDGWDIEWVVVHPVVEQLYRTISSRIVRHPLRGAPVGPPVGRQQPYDSASGMPVQCLSVIAWSCATLRLQDAALLQAINEIAAPRTHDFAPFELAQLIWAFAKLSSFPPELFFSAARRLLSRQRGEFKGLCLSMSAWAFGQARLDGCGPVFQSIANELPMHANDLRPQELASTLKTFVEVGMHNGMLFDSLGWAAASTTKLQGFRPEELADVICAFGAAGIQHEAFFLRCADTLAQKSWLMSSEAIANVLHAYAQLQLTNVSACDALLEALLAHAASGNAMPQDLAKALSASAELRLCETELLWRLAARRVPVRLLEGAVRAMPTQSLITMANSCADAQTEPPELFQTIVGECARRCGSEDAPLQLEMLHSALSLSTNSHLRGSPAASAAACPQCPLATWAAAAAAALSKNLPASGRDLHRKARGLLVNFRSSPAIGATAPLHEALERARKVESDLEFPSQATTMSTACPSDRSELRSEFFHLSSQDTLFPYIHASPQPKKDVPQVCAEVGAWDSIRQQSIAKSMEKGFAPPSLASHQELERPGLAPPPRLLPTPMRFSEPTWPASQERGATQAWLAPMPEPAPAPAPEAAPEAAGGRELWPLASLLKGGRPLAPGLAAWLALRVLRAAEELLPMAGKSAVQAVQCYGIELDEHLVPVLKVLPDLFDGSPASALALKFTSPEEACGGTEVGDYWPVLSYRLGLLLHCLAISGRIDPYPEDSPHRVVREAFGIAQGRTCPQMPHHTVKPEGQGVALLSNVIASCLRTGGGAGGAAPHRLIVEASLSVLAMQAELSISHPQQGAC